MFESLGRFAFNRRWRVLAGAVCGVLIAVVWGLGLFGVVVGGGFDVPHSESARAEDQSSRALGRDSADVLVLFTSASTTVAEPAFRSAVEARLAELPAAPISTVTTYWSTGSPSLVSTDQRSTYAVLELSGASEDARESGYESIAPMLEAPIGGLEVEVGGPVPLQVDINTQVREDIARAEALSMPIMLVLLVIVFGGLVAASLPLAIGGLAVLGSFTLLRLVSLFTDVSIFSINIVTMLGLALAIDYALFIVSRFREELRLGRDVEAALIATMSSAGRTVAFSGVTVAISLASLLLFPQLFLRSMAYGGICAVLVSMIGALTVLPALLAVVGLRIDRLRVVRRSINTARHRLPAPGRWHQIAHSVMQRPIVYVAALVPVLLLLGAPFLGVTFGTVDQRVLPSTTESRVVAERIEQDFPGGTSDPVEVVVTFASDVAVPANQAAVEAYRSQLAALPDVESAVVAAEAGRTVRIVLTNQLDAQSQPARDLVGAVRHLTPPDGAITLVGGPTAALVDTLASFRSGLPWMALWMAASTFVLLFMAFGSVVLPLKAVVMNALSLTATFGAIVWIFQDGHLSGPLDFTATGWVDSAQPLLILAIAFGLSMDYEVFLLSRIAEEWERTGDNEVAVAVGLQRTGRIITSAALILIIVFAAFATSGITFIKMIGVGMVIAILIDATVVRTLLVPATMQLLGSANWWAPAPLARFWQRYGVHEGDAVAEPRTHARSRTAPRVHEHRQTQTGDA